MKSVIGTVLIFATWIGGIAWEPVDETTPCTFNVPASRPAPEIVGPSDLTQRVRVMTQPDSPIAIVRLDVTEVNLATGPGWFEKSGSYTIDIRNISTEMLTDASVILHFRIGEGGAGSGRHARRPIRPGEQLRLDGKMGAGRGTGHSDREATITAVVDWVTTAGCKFKPSQTWVDGSL
jgi:hypothetical protein